MEFPIEAISSVELISELFRGRGFCTVVMYGKNENLSENISVLRSAKSRLRNSEENEKREKGIEEKNTMTREANEGHLLIQ